MHQAKSQIPIWIGPATGTTETEMAECFRVLLSQGICPMITKAPMQGVDGNFIHTRGLHFPGLFDHFPRNETLTIKFTPVSKHGVHLGEASGIKSTVF